MDELTTSIVGIDFPNPDKSKSSKTQLEKFKEAARDLETDDDPERSKERLEMLVRHKPVEKPE